MHQSLRNCIFIPVLRLFILQRRVRDSPKVQKGVQNSSNSHFSAVDDENVTVVFRIRKPPSGALNLK
jgi:hypothetical protein